MFIWRNLIACDVTGDVEGITVAKNSFFWLASLGLGARVVFLDVLRDRIVGTVKDNVLHLGFASVNLNLGGFNHV